MLKFPRSLQSLEWKLHHIPIHVTKTEQEKKIASECGRGIPKVNPWSKPLLRSEPAMAAEMRYRMKLRTRRGATNALLIPNAMAAAAGTKLKCNKHDGREKRKKELGDLLRVRARVQRLQY